MDHTIGIGEYIIVNNLEDRLITHALGSCVAVVFYAPKSEVGGMIHIALPKARDKDNERFKPGYFADVGLKLMFHQMQNKLKLNLNEIRITVVGGADSIRQTDTFKIGPKNLEEVFKILNHKGLNFDTNETGGHVSRTIVMELKTGILSVRKQPLII
jgi:chemotaxis protein CheD